MQSPGPLDPALDREADAAQSGNTVQARADAGRTGSAGSSQWDLPEPAAHGNYFKLFLSFRLNQDEVTSAAETRTQTCRHDQGNAGRLCCPLQVLRDIRC